MPQIDTMTKRMPMPHTPTSRMRAAENPFSFPPAPVIAASPRTKKSVSASATKVGVATLTMSTNNATSSDHVSGAAKAKTGVSKVMSAGAYILNLFIGLTTNLINRAFDKKCERPCAEHEGCTNNHIHEIIFRLL